tara:strand:- start:4878 stop:5591 length:714 start_codon:yes stop_codon:yes gene_type:complete
MPNTPSTVWDISNADFKKYVAESFFYNEIARKCGYKCCTNYRVIKKRIDILGLSTSHFKQNNNGGRKQKKQIYKVAIENSTYNRGSLKKRLINELGWKQECALCKCETSPKNVFDGRPHSMELDHINGVNNDHRLENLRFLCSNCHAKTDTFKGFNKKCKRQVFKCINCNKPCSQNAQRCRQCNLSRPKVEYRKVERPTLEQLEKDLETMPYTKVGQKYNVSDNTIRSWLRVYRMEK